MIDLEFIVGQCPLLGGDAVYRARCLYALYDPLRVYEDEDHCWSLGIQMREAGPSTEEDAYLIYPNPARDYLNIQLQGKYRALQSVQVRGLDGQLVWQQYLTGSRDLLEIPCEAWRSGLYLVEGYCADGSTFADKLLIIK